jgi:hypothetical protein
MILIMSLKIACLASTTTTLHVLQRTVRQFILSSDQLMSYIVDELYTNKQ